MSTAAMSSSYETVAPRSERIAPRASGVGLKIGGAVIAAAVILGGYWSISQVTDGTDAARGQAGWTAVPGGLLKIDAVERIATHKRIGSDFKRFRLQVTVAAHGEAMVIDRSSFRLTGYHVYLGTEPLRSRPSVKKIKAGAKAEIIVTYQVPRGAENLSLIFEGSDNPIPFSLKKNRTT